MSLGNSGRRWHGCVETLATERRTKKVEVIERLPANQRVTGSIPSQGTH